MKKKISDMGSDERKLQAVFLGYSLCLPFFLLVAGCQELWFRHTVVDYAPRYGKAILIRGAQPQAEDLRGLVDEYGVRTILNLRGAHPEEVWSREERETATSLGVRVIDLPVSSRGALEKETIAAFVQVVQTRANWPIFVHCLGGSHRTGALVAVYRKQFQHWDNTRAIAELRDFSYNVGWDTRQELLASIAAFTPLAGVCLPVAGFDLLDESVDLDKATVTNVSNTSYLGTLRELADVYQRYGDTHRPMPLCEKAAFAERDIALRHLSPEGLLRYKVEFDARGTLAPTYGYLADTAAWTGVYLAAQAFRYRVTGDSRALDQVKAILRGLSLLQRVADRAGYLARSLAYAHETLPREPDGSAHNWFPASGPWRDQYLYIGDTSHDQYVHVLFGYGIAFSLLASVLSVDDLALLRQDVGRIADHLLEHRYRIVGPDGQTTEHGDLNWNLLGFFVLEKLSWLQTMGVITEDPRLQEEYRRLAIEYRPTLRTARSPFDLKHSDHNMILTNYYNLIHFETAESYRVQTHFLGLSVADRKVCLKTTYLDSLERTMSQYEGRERNSLFDYIYCSALPDRLLSRTYQEEARQTLREMPLDRFDFTHATPPRKRSSVVPIDCRENDSYHWKGDPYQECGPLVRRARVKRTGLDFLIAYWMGRYYGFLSAPE